MFRSVAKEKTRFSFQVLELSVSFLQTEKQVQQDGLVWYYGYV